MSHSGLLPRAAKQSALASTALFWGVYLVILLVTGMGKAMAPEPLQPLLWGVTSSALILATSWALLRREGRTLRDAGCSVEPATFPRLLLGTGVGLAVFGLNVLVVASLGPGLHFERVGPPNAGTLLPVLGGILALACMEELGFRAYPLRKLLENLPAWQAQTIVAVAFGLCHLAFGWSWTAVLLGVIPNGYLFGISAAASRGLAVPIGIHAGLNLARWAIEQGGIWQVTSSSSADGVASGVATASGIAITLFAAFLFWKRLPRPSVRSSSAPGT